MASEASVIIFTKTFAMQAKSEVGDFIGHGLQQDPKHFLKIKIMSQIVHYCYDYYYYYYYCQRPPVDQTWRKRFQILGGTQGQPRATLPLSNAALRMERCTHCSSVFRCFEPGNAAAHCPLLVTRALYQTRLFQGIPHGYQQCLGHSCLGT